MDGENPHGVMTESNNVTGSQRRRSPRLASPPQANNKMALGFVAVKRSINVRKIAPRKTVAPSEHDKENTPRRSGSRDVQPKKQKVCTPTATCVPDQRASSTCSGKKKQKVSTPTVPAVPDHRASSSGRKKKQKAAMPSPILPSTPPPPSAQQDPDDAVWSHKVRRSYSRLSDKSLNSPGSRENLFGFDKLNTPEVTRGPRTALEVSASLPGLNSFTSLVEAADCGSEGLPGPEPDLNIPGVAVLKEKRRRGKKVQQIDPTELDVLAARMNAEFEEAEEFELFVE